MTQPSDDMALQKRAALVELFADHSAFIRSRLTNFVGRAAELTEIEQEIKVKLAIGGYVTITGQAGQGKSCVIARLVQTRLDKLAIEGSPELLAYHFIPFSPGADHQVELLHNLMSRLILKYHLSDIYVASDNRASLRQMFPTVLKEVVAKGGQEVIFIDGLDQLEHELTGERDLSFLPTNPPPGIVFVLGTRPDDTLKPLELLKPRHEYKLPELSRSDFDQILAHHQVKKLPALLVDQFYTAMDKNALYLDLVAQELTQAEASSPQAIIERVAANPENLFEFALNRLRKDSAQWAQVIKPVLGVLIVTQEPLSVATIGQVLEITGTKLTEAILKLGGLLAQDGQGRRYLYHLKLREYLTPDPHKPEKQATCDAAFLTALHKKIASFCEVESLWQDTPYDPLENFRRGYARQHYITHLYYAKEYQKLFSLLDKGEYGLHKVREYDVSTRAYAQDLDLGRAAASRLELGQAEGLELLPNLWRYTLLRTSLASRVDNYPLEIFKQLFLAGREKECLARVELLTDPAKKIQVLAHLGDLLIEHGAGQRAGEASILYLQALILASENVTADIIWVLLEHSNLLTEPEWLERIIGLFAKLATSVDVAWAWRELANALVKAGQPERAKSVFEQALGVANSIAPQETRIEALEELATYLAQAQDFSQAKVVFEQALATAQLISDLEIKVNYLRNVALALARAGEKERARVAFKQILTLIPSLKYRAEALVEVALSLGQAQERQWALAILEQALEATALILEEDEKFTLFQKIVFAFLEAQEYERAIAFAHTIPYHEVRTGELWSGIGQTLARAGHFEQALAIAEMVAAEKQAAILREIARGLAQIGEFEQAFIMANSISSYGYKTNALQVLVFELVNAERFEQALAIANSISIAEPKTESLLKIAKGLTQAEGYERARPVFAEALANTSNIQVDGTKTRSLAKLAAALAEAGDYAFALVVANSILDKKAKFDAVKTAIDALVKIEEYEQALSIVNLAPDNAAKVVLLTQIALPMRQVAHYYQQGQKVFEQALILAEAIDDEIAKARALGAVANLLILSKEIEETRTILELALPAANSISNLEQKELVLEDLVLSIAKVGKYEQALAITNSISDLKKKNRLLEELGEILAKAGKYEQALAITNSILDAGKKNFALSNLVKWLATTGEYERALAIAAHIPIERAKARALHRIIENLVKAGEYERALTIANLLPDSEEKTKSQKLGEIAIALAKIGEYERALQIANSIVTAETKASTLTALVEILGSAHKTELGKELIEQVLLIAQTITDDWDKTSVLDELAVALVKIGSYEQAQAIVDTFPELVDKTTTLIHMGIELAKLKEYQQAMLILEQAISLTNSMTDETTKNDMLGDITAALQWAEEYRLALAIANTISDSEGKAIALRILVEDLVTIEDFELVLPLAAADSIPESEITPKLWAYAELSKGLLKTGRQPEAVKILQKAWRGVNNRTAAIESIGVALPLLAVRAGLATELVEAFEWTENFLEQV